MKHSSTICSSAFLINITMIFLFLVILSSPALSTRPIPATTPSTTAARSIQVKDHIDQETEEGSELNMSQLMGWEVCKDGDEECLRRRIVAEAHLDYIYTQQHKH